MYGIIYKATNLVNQKVYIGQTINKLSERISAHFGLSKKRGTYFLRALKKYSKENFSWEIIDQASSKEELDQKEIFWIKELNSINPKFGYNSNSGGANGKPTEEVRKKISDSKLGDKNPMKNESTRQKVSESLKGKPSWNKGIKLPYSVWNKEKSYEETYGEEKSNQLKENHSKIMKGRLPPVSKAVVCVENGRIFDSIKHAYKFIRSNHYYMTKALDNPLTKLKNYHWEYLLNDDSKNNTPIITVIPTNNIEIKTFGNMGLIYEQI